MIILVPVERKCVILDIQLEKKLVKRRWDWMQQLLVDHCKKERKDPRIPKGRAFFAGRAAILSASDSFSWVLKESAD